MVAKDIISQYRDAGFEGFIPVSLLKNSASVLPDVGGVYIAIRNAETKPQFLEVGTGGFFKGKNPNVSLAELDANYVPGSKTVYVGKATSLRKRVGQLLRFGAGASVGHWGGRYLWQLADSDELLIAWKVTPLEDPREVEVRMLTEFVNKFGRLPFANLTY